MRLKTDFLFGGRLWPLLFISALVLLAPVLAAQEKTLTIDLGGGMKMEFVLIPAGSFMMGSDEGEVDEKPVHRVTITKPFYMGKYEVTQEYWQALMGGNPSYFKGPKNPVDNVSWDDCTDYIGELQAKVSGMKASLPTEAQWEYACRAGSTGKYYSGNGEAGLSHCAWYEANSDKTTHPVGGKKPNAWGLYDMLGNVMEWCADWYGDKYYGISPEKDPLGPDSGERRVLRGGSWIAYAVYCRSADRSRSRPAYRSNDGFRLVLETK